MYVAGKSNKLVLYISKLGGYIILKMRGISEVDIPAFYSEPVLQQVSKPAGSQDHQGNQIGSGPGRMKRSGGANFYLLRHKTSQQHYSQLMGPYKLHT